MKITVEIPEDILPSVEQFIERYHSERRFDEKTGQPKQVGLYTVTQFILHQVDALLDRIDDEFPIASSEAHREQIAALQREMKAKIKAKEVQE